MHQSSMIGWHGVNLQDDIFTELVLLKLTGSYAVFILVGISYECGPIPWKSRNEFSELWWSTSG